MHGVQSHNLWGENKPEKDINMRTQNTLEDNLMNKLELVFVMFTPATDKVQYLNDDLGKEFQFRSLMQEMLNAELFHLERSMHQSPFLSLG